jgi:peptide/nickel transport system ATP-binding protein
MNNKPILEIHNLSIVYPRVQNSCNAVNNISFSVYPGQFIAIAGESGSGKSTLASSIIGLLPSGGYVSGGTIHFEGADITALGRKIRGKCIGYIPQDALSGLDPIMRIGKQVDEAVLAHENIPKEEARKKTLQSLKDSGLPEQEIISASYPHELSGGMKQRVLIAAGLINKPSILIADEPTSALDVVVQQKILMSILFLIRYSNTALIFITHNMALTARYSDYVIVMKEGVIVEQGPTKKIWCEPKEAYTQNLIAAAHHTVSEKDFSVSDRYIQRNSPPILEVENITKYYRGNHIPAVNNAAFRINEGETLAVIGGSGSGKTTLASLILQLEEPSSGTIRFYGEDIKSFDKTKRKMYHKSLQAVFQNPGESLNPLFSVYEILEEPLRAFAIGAKNDRKKRIAQILDEVMLPQAILEQRPRYLSGGQCQRVAIARALITKPRLVICDEVVSALDALNQLEILNLLKSLKRELNTAYLFITHDLHAASLIADTIIVMKKGNIVETGTKETIFNNPKNKYTKILLEASLINFSQTPVAQITQTKGNIDEITA